MPADTPFCGAAFPARAAGSIDPTRLQRRVDDPRSDEATLTPNNNPLWPITRQWTDSDEIDYSSWIRRNVSRKFLAGSRVEVDCADAAIALRWIYARERGLPAAQTLAISGRLFGSWGSANEWDALISDADWKKDERFKAALRYLLLNVYTHSIRADLYPIEITPAYVIPGTIYLTLSGESGHTRTVTNIAPQSLEVIYGDMPAAERMYIGEEFPYWVPPELGGFMRFRWPEITGTGGGWNLRAPEQMPGYSLEQYEWGEYDYNAKFNERLELWNSLHDQIKGTAAALVGKISERVDVVAHGFYICSLVPCAPGSAEDSEHSTPQRDYQLARQAGALENLMARLDPTDWLLGDLSAKYKKPIMPGAALTFWDLFIKAAIARLKADPTLSLAERWNIPDTHGLDGFLLRAHVFYQNWRWRDGKIATAQTYCYPNGGSTPSCDPAMPELKELDTARLDQAFKTEKSNLNAFLAQLSTADQSAARIELQKQATQLAACPSSPNGLCTSLDLLNLSMIDNMTSSPLDPQNSRYGLP